MSGRFITPSLARCPLAGGSLTSMMAAMSLDSASAQQTAPAHTPTSTAQVIGTRWAVAAGHSLASEAAARGRAGGAGCLVHRALAVGHDVIRRGRDSRHRTRRARISDLAVHRLSDGVERRQVPPLAVLGGALPA